MAEAMASNEGDRHTNITEGIACDGEDSFRTKEFEDAAQTKIVKAVPFDEDDWQMDLPFMDCASHLYMNNHLSDVTFILTSETPARRVPAHKFILAMRSPVFEAMFYGPMRETKTEIIIADTPVNGFLLMLRFLYTDWTEVTPDDAMNCIQVAHMYRIPMCVQYCENVLVQSLDVSNVFSILEIAQFYGMKDLDRRCMTFLEANFASLLNTPDFLSAPQNVLQLILENLHPQLGELAIYQAVDNWAANQCLLRNVAPSHENKREYLGNAFSQLRVGHIPLNDFIASIVKENLLSESEKFAVYNYHHNVIPHLDFVNNNERCPSPQSTTDSEDGDDSTFLDTSTARSWLLHDCFTECAVLDIGTKRNINLVGAEIKNSAVYGKSSSFQAHAQFIMLYDRVACEQTWKRITGTTVSADGKSMNVDWEDIVLSKNHVYQLFMFVCSFRKHNQKDVSKITVPQSGKDHSPRDTNGYMRFPIPKSSLFINNIYVFP